MSWRIVDVSLEAANSFKIVPMATNLANVITVVVDT